MSNESLFCLGNIEKLENLIKTQNVNIADNNGNSPLHYAVVNGNYDLIQNKKKDIDSNAEFIQDEPKIVDLLIKSGANVNAAENDESRTPLHFAAADGKPIH